MNYKMKNISKSLMLTLGIFLFSSCVEKEEIISSEESELASSKFLRQNISIFDARVRSTSKAQYVRELLLPNFSDKPWDKTSIGFDGYLFEDNGLKNDLIKNDGIYTSVDQFYHNDKVPFLEGELVRSVLEMPIVSPEFIQTEALQDFAYKYELDRPGAPNGRVAGPVATIECDVKICSTGCIADWIWSGFGCVCVSNCKVKFGWE